MKTELIDKLEQLLTAEDITSIKQDVHTIHNDFKAELAKTKQLQLEAFDGSEKEESAEFKYEDSEEDKRFFELLNTYRDRIKEHGQKIAEEQKENLEQKQSLINDFKALVSGEENIKNAFDGFNAIRDKWDEIGDVPGNKYKDIHDEYQKLREEFFYNINIYKELRENDLKVNQKKKEDLIERAKKMLELSSMKELETQVRSYQKEWTEIGPSNRDSYKELADTFYGYCREAFEKIRGHYDGLKEKQEENLAKKKDLVEKLRRLVSLEIKNHSTWNKKTGEVIKLQHDWKGIGFAPKKDNEEVWQEFRGLCDLFFEKKGKFYEQRRSEQDGNRKAKEELIKKAEAIQGETNWKETTEKFLRLQQEWKKSGAASPRDEQKLWAKFRTACDAFFEAKKEHFSGMGERQENNLKAKMTLIKEIEKHEMTGKKNEDLAALKEFSKRFNEIGYVPKAKVQEVFDAYHKALDEKYGKIDMDAEERRMINYKERIEGFKSADNSDHLVRKETRLLQDKIERLKSRVLQYEGNMSIFTGSGADELKKEIEKKINSANKEIDEIKKKITLLRED